ncbi:hypothetical protein [Nocardia sp. CDC160]|uniref:hypothetical protein n=1 Tax=Nocardia sp. CDC160 TaxID=3112166 RepID=UPI002DBB4620|nr:hypothetical protein [Nocardia sp. CDC160]MEC3915183.1 hypothetical protein [Nocardia sp. CDC160]
MPQAHRSRPTIRRLSLALAPLAGAAATVLAAGPAAAESLSRGTDSSTASSPSGTLSGCGLTGDTATGNGAPTGRSGTGIITHGDDPTGVHANDPFGYYHSDMNPVLQNQHPRPPSTPAEPAPQPLKARAGSPSTWSPSWSEDGKSYTVCRPLATYC